GYGISQPDLGYDDYAGLDVRGKIVVVLRHTPDGDEGGKFGPYALLTYKTMTAREKGAAGILLLTGPASERPENLGYFQLDSASADCGIPAGFVKREWVEKLIAPKTLRELQVTMAHGKPASFEIPEARAELKVDVVRQMARTRNVLGFLEGADPRLRKEVVIVGAHYDHLGLGGSHSLSGSSEPAIHHGADDNASGTAGVLELAQYFAANRKKLGRSILFMTFSGEEMGLIGSEYWTKKPTIPLARVAAMINLDMVGRLKNDTVQVIGAGSSPVWEKLLAQANQREALSLRLGGDALAGTGGSDDQSFNLKKIPTLFFFTGVHSDYHKPSDTWDKINTEGEAKLLRVVAETVRRASWVKPRPVFVKAKETGPVASPGFRVSLGTIPDYAATAEGVTLQGVREGSPAQKAGIRAGDILIEFDGKKIRNVQEYTVVLSSAKPNVPVQIVVLRDG
ncbi:MAG TPA: M28 family peptidase, partial [Armatimonadota bacterium]|nr:M28 family peptidase [Armatimonadota bacterium]